MDRIFRLATELLRLGPGFHLWVIGRALGLKSMKLTIAGVGQVHVRPADSDASTFSQVFAERSYDLSGFAQQRRINEAYQGILASGRTPVIVDAGANVGAAMLWFAKLYPRAQVVAIEPSPSSAEICRRNAAAVPNARVVQAGIGSRPGALALESAGQSWAVTTVRATTGDVELITMSDAVASVPGGELFIAKIDIEGFESDLFETDTEWASTAPLVFIEPHDWLFPGRQTSNSFRRTFNETGHELLLRGENLVFVL